MISRFEAQLDRLVIEQADELACLKELGPAFGQGYLIARPASLDEFDLSSDLLLPAVSH